MSVPQAAVRCQGQTTELTVVFVLVGMMFLVPAITEKALAITYAFTDLDGPHFYDTDIPFTNLRWHLDAGKFDEVPHFPTSGPPVQGGLTWTTEGTGIFGGDEKGYVQVDVSRPHLWASQPKVLGTVTFHFSNPLSGTNTCSVDTPSPEIAVGCIIPTHGSQVELHYCVLWTPPTLPPPKSCTPPTQGHTIFEKKPNSYVHTSPSGKMILPHYQSHFRINKMQIPMTGASSKVTSGGAMAHRIP